jgi:hypothetical protein
MQHMGSICKSGHLIDIVADKTGIKTCAATIIVLVRALLPGIHSARSSQQQLYGNGFNKTRDIRNVRLADNNIFAGYKPSIS